MRALYTMPTLHNPTTATMPVARREAVAEMARRHDVALIEDDVYGFLLDAPLRHSRNMRRSAAFTSPRPRRA